MRLRLRPLDSHPYMIGDPIILEFVRDGDGDLRKPAGTISVHDLGFLYAIRVGRGTPPSSPSVVVLGHRDELIHDRNPYLITLGREAMAQIRGWGGKPLASAFIPRTLPTTKVGAGKKSKNDALWAALHSVGGVEEGADHEQ